MEEWTSYTIANFIPFSAEVYLRLIERVNDTWWPLHLATFAVGVVALVLTLTRHRRFAGPLLALLWVWCGYGFFQQFYVDLNWAGTWFARGFYLQAALLAFLMPFVCRKAQAPRASTWTGLLLIAVGLMWPVITGMSREGLLQTETLGIHPDPTALSTLGFLLLALRKRWLWVLLPIPIMACLISGLTLLTLGLGQAWILLAAPAVALCGAFWPTAKKDVVPPPQP